MKTSLLFATSLMVVGIGSAGPAIAADDSVKSSAAAESYSSSDASAVEAPAVIDHVVYLAKLPSPADLMRGAELKATPIVRMDQTADRIIVVYQYAGGRTVTFAYTLLSTASSSRAPAPAQTSGPDYSVVTPTAPPIYAAPTVVYAEPPVVYYAPRVQYYDPAWDFWTPFAVGVGLGWIGGSGHGYSGHGYSGHGYSGHGYGHGGGSHH